MGASAGPAWRGGSAFRALISWRYSQYSRMPIWIVAATGMAKRAPAIPNKVLPKRTATRTMKGWTFAARLWMRGWMTVFRQWVQDPAFYDGVWPRVRHSYNPVFQAFVDRLHDDKIDDVPLQN